MSTRKKQDFHNDDQYNTTKDMWESISHLIPKDKILFEGFMKDNYSSKSVLILRELGFDVVGDPTIDFFGEIPKYDILVSNPPYSIKKKIPLSRCWFDTCYLCYKINLERDITFI